MSDVAVTSLTHFLLARIAEDEAAARDELPNIVDSDFLFKWQPARVLAECAAKRAIVEECVEILAIDGWEYSDTPDLADNALRHLAAVYADHEDYDPDWRL